MRPNTENLLLYTRQSREEGFQLVLTRFMNDNTLQAALQGGSRGGTLLSLASGKAGERGSRQQKRSGPACLDPERDSSNAAKYK